MDLAAARVAQRVACDLRQRRGDSGLILTGKAELLGHDPRALTGMNDVILHLELKSGNGPLRIGVIPSHDALPSLTTITDASSRARA